MENTNDKTTAITFYALEATGLVKSKYGNWLHRSDHLAALEASVEEARAEGHATGLKEGFKNAEWAIATQRTVGGDAVGKAFADALEHGTGIMRIEHVPFDEFRQPVAEAAAQADGVTVPRNPTVEQVLAGQAADPHAHHVTDIYTAMLAAAPTAQPTPKLDDIEQYRVQMAAISTASLGYWKEGDSIRPEYDTIPLRDVARLYAKYEALRAAQPTQNQIDTHLQNQREEHEHTKVTLITEPTPEAAEFYSKLGEAQPTQAQEYKAWLELMREFSGLEAAQVEWVENTGDAHSTETVKRLANLIHAIRIGDHPSTLLAYLRDWLAKEKVAQPTPPKDERAVVNEFAAKFGVETWERDAFIQEFKRLAVLR